MEKPLPSRYVYNSTHFVTCYPSACQILWSLPNKIRFENKKILSMYFFSLYFLWSVWCHAEQSATCWSLASSVNTTWWPFSKVPTLIPVHSVSVYARAGFHPGFSTGRDPASVPLCSHPRYTRWGGGGIMPVLTRLDQWGEGAFPSCIVHQIYVIENWNRCLKSLALWPTSGADPGFSI